MLGFLIWELMGIAFLGLGVWAIYSKREVAFGFWANAETFPVKDVKLYNRAVGKLWIVFGVVFMILGIPLLQGQNSPYVVCSSLGNMREAIVVIVVYTTIIEKKYRK